MRSAKHALKRNARTVRSCWRPSAPKPRLRGCDKSDFADYLTPQSIAEHSFRSAAAQQESDVEISAQILPG